jgi:hypothetical protein
MVKHDIAVSGIQLNGATQTKPVVLQMNREDFPAAFLQDLKATGKPPLSSTHTVIATTAAPGTLFQPVARVAHVALVELQCETVGFPRVDPSRVISAGLVIRRIPRTGGVSEISKPDSSAWPWMKDPNGQFSWGVKSPWTPDDDPDPVKRPQLQSGRADLDQLLAAKALSTALTEVSTPAFVAAPDICAAAGRTFVYALIPTASSEASTAQAPNIAQMDDNTVLNMLPTLLKAGSHNAPQSGQSVTLQFMSDDWCRANNKTDFLTFSATLRLLYQSFGAFDGSTGAQKLLSALNARTVTVGGSSRGTGDFFQSAATALIDFDPNSGGSAPSIQMPTAWQPYSTQDQKNILAAMKPLLQSRSVASSPPQGRFQDASRLYRVRLFFRIKGETAACPPQLVWSSYSDPFRIAAWYESSGRPAAPVPMPDPFDKNALKNAKPTASFAVPPSLMGAMNGASLTGLSAGTPPAGGGGGINIMWICSFSIPLITICAFFVLNIFLTLLNIVFFWMAFIKICIPIPIPAPSPSPQED